MANPAYGSHVARRRGAGWQTILIATTLFGAVCGAVMFVGQNSPAPQAVSKRDARQEAATPKTASNQVEAAGTVAVNETVEANVPVDTNDATPTEPLTPAEELADELAAGEFNGALARATSIDDIAQKAQLLKLVVDAQIEAGEFQAARRSIRRMGDGQQQAESHEDSRREESLAGGSMANFGPLIDLIQNETSGPWMDLDSEGGTVTENDTGVRVDPNGLLHELTQVEQNNRLKLLGDRARAADLNDDLSRASELRLVSLKRLEQAVAGRLADGRPVIETMKQMAGLTAIQYVFVYPESGDIVIGGPAEGWRYTSDGQAVGSESGAPTLNLDDLVVVLRTFSDSGLGIFGCSINPRPDGLKQLKQFVDASSQRGSLSPKGVDLWAKKLQDKLGLQDIEIYGIPTTSRVARVIVEADYRMKLIGIKKLDAGKNIPSVFDLMPQQGQQKPSTLDALRWWLTMQYENVLHSDDHSVFEIRGASVLCQSENQIVTNDGQRIQTGKADDVNRQFAANFTRHYQELAASDSVFADLQNIFDLALVAALIRHEQLTEKTAWNLGSFAVDGDYQAAEYEAPATVMSVVNHEVFGKRDVVVQVAGGVRADLLSVFKDTTVWKTSPRLRGLSDRAKAPELPHGRWWWDAE